MDSDLLQLTSLSDADRERFRITVNLLFTEGFLIRALEAHERAYRFAIEHLDIVESYLSFAGWELRRDESLGVIAFVGPASARLRLRKDESIVVLILRLLYEEKAGEIELHGQRTVRRHEIQDRYQALTRSSIKKTPFLALLRRFQSLRLIRIVGDDTDPDATIVLLPSLPFAIDASSIEELETRMTEYLAGSTEDAAEDASDDAAEDDGDVADADEDASKDESSDGDEKDLP